MGDTDEWTDSFEEAGNFNRLLFLDRELIDDRPVLRFGTNVFRTPRDEL